MAIINVAENRAAVKKIAEDRIAAALKQIVITNVDNVLLINDDNTAVTVGVNEVVVITGTLDVPDTSFQMPISRDGKVSELFMATVKDGVFTVKVRFTSTGQYTYSNDDANLDLDEQTYNVATIKINVIETIE